MGAAVKGLRSSILKKKKKKKGWGGGWKDRFDIPKGEATPILLTEGDYEDEDPESIEANGGEAPHFHFDRRIFHSYTWYEGKTRKFRQRPCTATWQQFRDRQGHKHCIGCYLKKQGDKRAQNREQFSINAIHLGLYQKVPLTDYKTGKIRRWEEDSEDHKRGDPILGWKPVTAARDRKEALANLDEGIEDGTITMWRKKYFQIGSGHKDQLFEIVEMAEKHCRCGGSLTPIAFFCRDCGEELCDVTEANMEPEDVLRYAEERQRCDSCGHFEQPSKEFICDECNEPEALRFNEVVAYVRKRGEGKDSTVYIDKVVPIYEFEFPDGTGLCEYDEELDDVIMDEDDNFVIREDLQKLVINQFDFDKVHDPGDDSDDYICRMLGIDNPFDQGSGESRDYRKSKSRFRDDDDDTEEDTPKKKKRPSRRGRSRSRR